MSASLIGNRGSSWFLILVGLIDHAGHASLRSLDGPLRAEPLQACMGSGSGEPRFWSRSKRSRHFRLHPSRRPRGTIRPGSVGSFWLGHAVASDPSRNSVPSTHMRCRTTAILRATAAMAPRRPLVFISRMLQAFRLDHLIGSHEHGICGGVEGRAHVGVAGVGYATGIVLLA